MTEKLEVWREDGSHTEWQIPDWLISTGRKTVLDKTIAKAKEVAGCTKVLLVSEGANEATVTILWQREPVEKSK